MSRSSSFSKEPSSFRFKLFRAEPAPKGTEENGFRPELVRSEKCDDRNTISSDGCKRDGVRQDSHGKVIRF